MLSLASFHLYYLIPALGLDLRCHFFRDAHLPHSHINPGRVGPCTHKHLLFALILSLSQRIKTAFSSQCHMEDCCASRAGSIPVSFIQSTAQGIVITELLKACLSQGVISLGSTVDPTRNYS